MQEARERVRAVIRHSGCEFPMRRMTFNLALADMKKESPSYDLPIPFGTLASSSQLDEQAKNLMYLGYLFLDSSPRHTKGILPIVAMAKDAGFVQVFLPEENAREGALMERIIAMPVSSLGELVSLLRGESAIEPYPADNLLLAKDSTSYVGPEIFHVRRQENTKRAMEVTAAGIHSLMMNGPPRSAKTLPVRPMPSVLLAMGSREALEATKVYIISGMLPLDQLRIRQDPFRSPLYTTSHAGLVGGAGHNALESLR